MAETFTPQPASALSATRCGHCQAFQRPDGKPLLPCPCLLQTYCGKRCQKRHWRVHQTICTSKKPPIESPYDTGWCSSSARELLEARIGVVIALEQALDPGSGHFTSTSTVKLWPSKPEVKENYIRQQQLVCNDLPASRAVGFSLQVCIGHDSKEKIINKYNAALFLDVNVNSPTFRKPNWEGVWDGETPPGSMMVLREDRRLLHFLQVQVLAEFCQMFIQTVE